ncbi:MAG: DUF3467 domain-containing protein [Methanocorpusculum sp.]|jgi:hypothetical protein|uniref:DUF3467 domain-containing protein n=1 Tax=Methanocorpusculum sp. TaxID=2058474 RepID=UPI0027215F79|nr:DUF3467 domain-containing protein [Methanocorpusculum sp.]MDO9523500.1 DUF3467 domain-containing protein [Methanocorpusculum sp.]
MAGNELNIQIPQNLDPVYSNMIQIAFKDDEFTMMFLHQLPVANQAKAKAIVAISPKHAKKLLEALQKSVNDYEAKFGQITSGAHAEGTDTPTLQGYS